LECGGSTPLYVSLPVRCHPESGRALARGKRAQRAAANGGEGSAPSAFVDILEAERLVETVKLRNALTRKTAKLLPEAIRQAKPKGGRKRKDGTRTPARAGSAALLRLIARLAMRDIWIERKK
jgi:hypothetical protein